MKIMSWAPTGSAWSARVPGWPEPAARSWGLAGVPEPAALGPRGSKITKRMQRRWRQSWRRDLVADPACTGCWTESRCDLQPPPDGSQVAQPLLGSWGSPSWTRCHCSHWCWRGWRDAAELGPDGAGGWRWRPSGTKAAERTGRRERQIRWRRLGSWARRLSSP